MSDSEYDTDDASSIGSDTSCSTEASEATEATYTSLEAALADMTARLAELDHALDTTTTVAQTLEQPVTAIAVSAFTNPRVLEAAPFRTTKFRLKPAAKVLLGTPRHTVTFSELCAAVRTTLRTGDVLEASDFLGVLQRLPEIIE